jgi:dephospho-CoA kinase
MLKIALTGGIATGKSHVLAALKRRGVPVIDADDIVHEAFGPGTAATQAVAAQFGSAFLTPDGHVDRSQLAVKVFRDPAARRQVEAIVHPVVYETIRKWFAALDGSMGVASIPLLYETGRDRDFDFVVVTVCPPEIQLQRLLARDGMSEEQAHQRIAAQIPAAEKAARGHFVILTGGAKLDTERQVDELVVALSRAIESSSGSQGS